ncbi:hypothetical protein Tco_1572995, partial [Tanacetum coccineum]
SENKRNLDEELAATKKKNTVKRVADEEYTERRIASKDCWMCNKDSWIILVDC